MEITATQPVRGVNIPIRSIVARKPAPAAARPLMTIPTTAIPMGAGHSIHRHSTGANRTAGIAAIRIMNTPATV